MDRTDVLRGALGALAETSDLLAELIRRQENLAAPVGGSSTWCIREAAVHLVVSANVHAELASGAGSPVARFARPELAAYNAQANADIPEAEPDKIARLLVDAVERFARSVADQPGHLPASYHGGHPVDLADVAVLLAAEVTLHGHDIARACGAAWTVSPALARLVLAAWVPMLADPGALVLSLAGRRVLAPGEFPDLFTDLDLT